MGLLDAIGIIGGGVARGYRANQKDQLDIAEQKRKALLEQSLADANIKNQATETQLNEYKLKELKDNAAEDQIPLTKDGKPLTYSWKDTDGSTKTISFPATGAMLSHPGIHDLVDKIMTTTSSERNAALLGDTRLGAARIGANSRERVNQDRMNFRLQYGVGSSSGTPIQRWRSYLSRVALNNPGFNDPEELKQWQAGQIDMLSKEDPEAYNAAHGITPEPVNKTKKTKKYKLGDNPGGLKLPQIGK